MLQNRFLLYYILCFGLFLSCKNKKDEVFITIVHTNDTHSQLFPLNDKIGGIERRATLIKKIRSENENVLFLDGGDFCQGTPYFNFFKGELEFKTLSMMGCDVATLGNHEYDYGAKSLSDAILWADFPILQANYDFENSDLKGKTIPYKIFNIDGVKVGVIGLTVELKGLVFEENCKNVNYLNPIETAEYYAEKLKKQGVDIVICLSHLGFTNANGKVTDKELAAASKNIDIIIGGHSHTELPEGHRVKNIDGKDVIIAQTGSKGRFVGKIDLRLEKQSE